MSGAALGGTRVANIPIHHLMAELWAAPLTIPAAFQRSLVTLQPEMKGAMASLWRATESQILGSNPALAVDEVVSLRDVLWFQTGDARSGVGAVPLHRFLRALAERTLRPAGAVLLPRLPDPLGGHGGDDSDDAVAGRQFFRWLSLALPTDLLVAASALPRAQVQFLLPVLDQTLRDLGFAESHLHIGAAVDFPLLWVSAQHALLDARHSEAQLESPGSPLSEGADLAPWLLRCFMARYLIAAFLIEVQRGTREPLAQALPGLLARVGETLGPGQTLLLRGALRDLARGAAAPLRPGDFLAMQRICATLTGLQQRDHLEPSLEALRRSDPLCAFFPAFADNAEQGLIATGLAYLQGADDPVFARLFWQAQRLRILFFRHVTQRPMTPGLQWFVRFFRRLKPLTRPLGPAVRLHAAALLCGAEDGLRSLEVRTAPEDTISGARRQMTQFEDAAQALWRRWPQLELGLVLHFTKERDSTTFKGLPPVLGRGAHADPAARQNSVAGCRFAAFAQVRSRQATALVRLLQSRPRSLALLRGLDFCTDELGVPTWVLAPLLRLVREASGLASAQLHRLGLRAPPLHLTVHAGEDFVHLLGGLRRVDEALRHLPLLPGDRIGHALALGTDPHSWAASAGAVPQAREDRLFDLAWEWGFWLQEGVEPPAGRLVALEAELVLQGQEMFGPISATRRWPDRDLLLAFVAALHDRELLSLWRFPAGVRDSRARSEPQELLWRYLTSPAVYQLGQRVVMVDAQREGAALASLQRALRAKVGRRGVTVEVNPSSNLLVGNLCDLQRHPLWRLRSPMGTDDAPPVPLCLGSDDPVTFATNTRQEYQLVYDTLSQAGLSAPQILAWLEGVRHTGLVTRFTLPAQEARRCLA